MGPERKELTLSENADFEWDVQLETSACSIIDLTGYGARLQFRDAAEGTLILEASHNTYITVNTTTDTFQIDIPQSVVAGKKEDFRIHGLKGVYDLVVFPGASTETADPVSLFFGPAKYRIGVTELS